MSRTNLYTVLGIGTAGVVIAVIAAFVILGGDDDAARKGTCRGVSYELNAERDSDDNRMEASLEIKANASGEPWQVEMTSNDKQVLSRTVTSDDEAEVDATAFLGTGEKVQRIEARFAPQGEKACSATVTLG